LKNVFFFLNISIKCRISAFVADSFPGK